jgi:hypothetical protein
MVRLFWDLKHRNQRTCRYGGYRIFALVRAAAGGTRFRGVDPENRDLRQLLWHRHRLVQMRSRIMNQLQALAMNEGKRWKKKLWSEKGRAELRLRPLT